MARGCCFEYPAVMRSSFSVHGCCAGPRAARSRALRVQPWLISLSVALLGVSACGARAELDSLQTGEFGTGGGLAAGGTPTTGGTPATGTSGSSGGAAGASQCVLAQDPGPCEAHSIQYAFDHYTGVCVPFAYGGCGGNSNRFATQQDCYAACGGQGFNDYAACLDSADCTYTGLSCCGPCGEETGADWVALNEALVPEWMSGRCHLIDGCTSCINPDTRNLWSSCEAGHCVLNDLDDSPLTACSDGADCVLRNGLDWCERALGPACVIPGRHCKRLPIQSRLGVHDALLI